MCEICRCYLCPPNCPSYNGWSAELGKCLAVCARCGELLYEEDEAFEIDGKTVCEDCVLKEIEISGNRS